MRHLAFILLLAATSACAQHGGHSAYAGQQHRDIKALSDKEVADLLAGAGMGYAKAAELNRHPGPMHALEHADALELSAAQREALSDLMKRHKAEARELGAKVVALERELDQLFAARSADERSVDRVLGELAAAQARLRGSHLKTHLETTRLLAPAQIDRYVRARGYAGTHSGEARRHSH